MHQPAAQCHQTSSRSRTARPQSADRPQTTLSRQFSSLFPRKFCEDAIRLESHLRKPGFTLFADFFPGSRGKFSLLRPYPLLLQLAGHVTVCFIYLLRGHFLGHLLSSSFRAALSRTPACVQFPPPVSHRWAALG